MEPRQGVEIVSRMDKNRSAPQRHFSSSAAQRQGPAGNQGNQGGPGDHSNRVQRSNTGLAGYPTAKFGKEYYVLDV